MRGLTLEQAREMLLHVARRMRESKDTLTEADRAIGDGDHGVGMARGFAAVESALSNSAFADLAELFNKTGMALLTSTGGAAGAIFATLFRGGAKGLAGLQVLDAAALSTWLNSGLVAVRERGKAQPGDKTMVDALSPAAAQTSNMREADLPEALRAVVLAAGQGKEATKNMVAKVGKAKALGERSLGHADPGALSTYLMLQFMLEYVEGKAQDL